MIRQAQEWSEYNLKLGKMKHSTSEERGNQGENLAMMWDSSKDYTKEWDTTPTQRWYDEIQFYDYNTPEFPENFQEVGHFTQVVWKGSKQLGCGHATDGWMVFTTCRYDPPGNYYGEFIENVPKLI